MPFLERFAELVYNAGSTLVVVAFAAYPVKINDFTTEDVARIANQMNMGTGINGPDYPGPAFNKVRGFLMEMIGNEDVDVPTPLGALWRAGGFKETQTLSTPNITFGYSLPNTPASFNLISDSGDVDPLDLLVDVGPGDAAAGQGTSIADAIAENIVLTYRHGEIPTCAFDFRGNVDSASGPVVSGLAATTQKGVTVPAEPINSNNLALSIDVASGGAITSLLPTEIICNINNTVNPRPDMSAAEGFNAARIVGRNQSYTLKFELPPIGTLNPTTDFKARKIWDVTFVYDSGGTGSNKILTTTFFAQVVGAVVVGPEDGIQMATVELMQARTGGDFLMQYST